jgi:hypothetical protein
MRNLLAAAVVAVAASAPTPARAGGDALPLIGGLVFGAVLGAIVTDSRRDYYPPPPVYYAPPPPVTYRPERQCVTDWHWDSWGRRHWYQRCYWVHAPVYGYGY